MANIFTLENIDDFTEKINIDELYEKKHQYDLQKLELFNKILNRIHVRIKTTSKQKIDEQFCWYVVPEIIIGVPKYDQGACIAYLMDKLKGNGFIVRYIHPNTLFIGWKHWVPSYVRSELKKKTGIVIDEYGKKIEQDDNNETSLEPKNMNEIMFKTKDSNNAAPKQKKTDNTQYKPVNTYKPSGNFIYNDDLINKLEGKFS
uniref:Uncharacterized protein n=1 Tax=viral metagenome TaxID=1070528 RepID=A0A6C0DUT9_9ZZZZ